MATQSHHLTEKSNVLKAARIDTPLGAMLAIGDESALFLVEFEDCRGIEREIERLCLKKKAAIILGSSPPLVSIEAELRAYFAGELREFKTPVKLLGSPFQQLVWRELQNIPYGETRSYLYQAKALGKPTGFRAVANANGVNQLAILIPCHRVINSSGELGGYGGGVERKKWLIDFENSHQ
jgi:AraC family transcriptional regulator of adaptative response/methylated-DNA-[protein]-cysteine methyltransferase